MPDDRNPEEKQRAYEAQRVVVRDAAAVREAARRRWAEANPGKRIDGTDMPKPRDEEGPE